jgi:hypothetical protein
MRAHQRRGDLSKGCYIGESNSIISSGDADIAYLSHAIGTLFRTGAVAIQVEHPELFQKRRVSKQILFITHGRLFGDPRGLVVGLLGGGCELLRLDNLKATQLIRAGLPAQQAKEVVAAIEAHI